MTRLMACHRASLARHLAQIANMADTVSQPNAYKLGRPAVAPARAPAHDRTGSARSAARPTHGADATHYQNSTQSTRT